MILDLDNLSSATNHNGGALHFGPDGKLYVAVGENANAANAQTLGNLLGKMLRINPDGTIPTDNPFFTTATGTNRAIWALGLRNPFTFAFSPAPAAMFINDVGQNTWEEINDGIAGANYGWPDTEGPTTDPRFDSPLYAYGHRAATGCAITGGAFYTPPRAVPGRATSATTSSPTTAAAGSARLDPANGNTVTTFATGIATSPVDLKVAPTAASTTSRAGRRHVGVVYRIAYGATRRPTITAQPAEPDRRAGSRRRSACARPARRRCATSGSATAPTSRARRPRRLHARIGRAGRQRRDVPRRRHQRLRQHDERRGGAHGHANQRRRRRRSRARGRHALQRRQTITFAGTGTDPEDGTLPASAFTWRVDFHHDTHTHPFMPRPAARPSGSFTIPTTGETSANVWYRIHLTVRDSGGADAHDLQRDVLPRKVTLTLATSPAGLQLAARRPAGRDAAHLRASSASSAAWRRQPADVRLGDLRVRVVVGRRRGSAHDQHAGDQHHLHGHLSGSAPGGTGRGLSATYFNNADFTGSTVTRIDPTIDFTWGTGAPAAASARTPSACAGPARSRRRSAGPTPSTRSATTACGCGSTDSNGVLREHRRGDRASPLSHASIAKAVVPANARPILQGRRSESTSSRGVRAGSKWIPHGRRPGLWRSRKWPDLRMECGQHRPDERSERNALTRSGL